ncbi:MAG: GNAT family N-acetyltransferase [Candidatus Sabulitectum sp.]|nr:GNAT family N-acetyltransferase [Candidatus Sabulitectum sp.]
MTGRFEFKPFDENEDLELVLVWLIETKRAIPDTDVDIALERKHYFADIRIIQAREKEFASVLYLDNKPVGYLCTFPMPKHPESAWLDFCYLIPGMRGTEASNLITERTVQLAEQRGCKAIFLNVHHLNHRATAFYEKNGWQLQKKKDDGYIRMKKSLAHADSE